MQFLWYVFKACMQAD